MFLGIKQAKAGVTCTFPKNLEQDSTRSLLLESLSVKEFLCVGVGGMVVGGALKNKLSPTTLLNIRWSQSTRPTVDISAGGVTLSLVGEAIQHIHVCDQRSIIWVPVSSLASTTDMRANVRLFVGANFVISQ